MSFQALKKQSKLGSLTEKLVEQVEKMNSSSSSQDDRFWKPTLGKEGVGSAIIRFLPAPEGEELPWAKLYTHGFQGPTGAWYLESSLTTLNQKDPVTEYNRSLVMKHSADGKFDSCPKSVQDTVRRQKRKLSYYSNIYVIKDPANPDNEGKIFLYKFGKKIFDKILGVMQPEFEDETPINPFDFWNGANFKLKIVKKDGYWNYDRSEFDRPSPLLDDDDALESIWKKEHSLTAFTAADKFKSYEELENRMNLVLGLKTQPTQSRAVMEQEDEIESYNDSPSVESKVMEELEQSYARSKSSSSVDDDDEDTNNTLDYFQSLIDD